ncbi:MAG: hypothetical protein EOM68_20805 [Spirochaetia bacterium]|nr:hypothetical protein [Spirochaetia bacterium]
MATLHPYDHRFCPLGVEYQAVFVARCSGKAVAKTRFGLDLGQGTELNVRYPGIAYFTDLDMSDSTTWQLYMSNATIPIGPERTQQVALESRGANWTLNIYGDSRDLLIDRILLLRKRE